jgi:hypothetical protein
MLAHVSDDVSMPPPGQRAMELRREFVRWASERKANMREL